MEMVCHGKYLMFYNPTQTQYTYYAEYQNYTMSGNNCVAGVVIIILLLSVTIKNLMHGTICQSL